MEAASNFETGNEGNRLIRKLTKLNKKIQHKPSTLEKLICLSSEFNDNKIYTDYCRGQIEMFERIRQFEKDFPCGLEYPLPPDPSPDKEPAVKPLPPPATGKIIKSFPEYLVLPVKQEQLAEKQHQLADICKSVFNKNESPKDYAIMLCLLSQGGFISVPDRKRKEFYESWYSFISKPFPDRGNFTSINKHISFMSSKHYNLKNKNDIDYLRLEENFVNALQKLV